MTERMEELGSPVSAIMMTGVTVEGVMMVAVEAEAGTVEEVVGDFTVEEAEEAVDIVEETVEEAEVDATVEVVAVDATVEEVEEAAIKYDDIFTYDMYMCTIACSNEIKDYTGVTCNLGGWHPYTVNYFSDI